MIGAKVYWPTVLLFLHSILLKTCNANSTTIQAMLDTTSSLISSPSSMAETSTASLSDGSSSLSSSDSSLDEVFSTTTAMPDATVSTTSIGMSYTTKTIYLEATTTSSLSTTQIITNSTSHVYSTVANSSLIATASTVLVQTPSKTNTTSHQTSPTGNGNSTSMPTVGPITTVLSAASSSTAQSVNLFLNNSYHTKHTVGIYESMTGPSTFTNMIQHSTHSVIMKSIENSTIFASINSAYSTSATVDRDSTATATTLSAYAMSSFPTSMLHPWNSSTLTSEPATYSQKKMQVSSVSITAAISTSHFPLTTSASIVTTPRPVAPYEFLIFRMTSLLVNSTFTDDLNNRTSNNYSTLVTSVKNELQMILNDSAHFKDVAVVNLLNNNNAVEVIVDVYYNFSMNVSSENIKTSIQMKSRRFAAISVKERCSRVSCSNGGTCRETSIDVSCSCMIGFSGARCLMTYPVAGNYTEWSAYQSCSKSCGGGFQIRVRTCTNPVPMHGGLNCSSIGAEREMKPCNEDECPDIDWVIWLIVGAGALILLLVVILACCFQKRKKFYYKDYGLTQDGRSYSLSTAAYVNKVYEGNLSEFRSQESIIPMGVLKEDPFRNGHTNQQFEADEANHNGGTVYERELRTFLGNTNKIRAKEPADTGEYLEPEHTFHTPKKPEHVTTAQVVYEDTPERLL